MRGRRPTGPRCVRNIKGSEIAKQRAEVILETLTGQTRVVDACRRLHISEPRYHQLKKDVLKAVVEAVEPKQAGRPPHTATPEQAQLGELQQQLQEKELELRAAQARAEIAVTLPRVAQQPPPSEKKTTARRSRRRRTSGKTKSM